MSESLLSIIIVNWNTADLLAACLDTVQAEVKQLPLGAAETIVVDNASSDDSVMRVRTNFPWVQLIENQENVGFARANNQAIQTSSGNFVLLLNSDAFLGQSSLPQLLAFASDHPRAGAIGPRLVNLDGTYQAGPNRFPTLISSLLEPWGIMQWATRNPHYPSFPPEQAEDAQSCDWVGGACLLVRRAAIAQVGALDESFFMNSEEVEWCWRMRQGGWEVWYTPTPSITHLGGASAARKSPLQRLRLYAGKVRFIQKCYGPIQAVGVRLNYRLSSLVKSVAFGLAAWLFQRDAAHRQALSHWAVARARWP